MNENERSHRIREIVLAARKQYLRSTNARRLELEAMYRKAGVDLSNEIIGAFPDRDLRAADLSVLENLADLHLGTLVNNRNALFTGVFLAAASSGSKQARPIANLLPGVEVSTAALDVVNAETITWLEGYVVEDGLQLSPRLWRNDLGARRRIQEVIEEGIASGEAIHRTAENFLAGAVDADTVRIIEKAFGQNRAVDIAKDVQELFTRKGTRNIVFNVERVLITESNRVYRKASIEGFQETGAIGARWNLASSHPKPDVCDGHATADKHGLGPGGYPFDEYPVFPAHPLDLCYDTPIYPWEVN